MKEGVIHADLGVAPGKKIPAATLNTATKQAGVLGCRARLAKTLTVLGK